MKNRVDIDEKYLVNVSDIFKSKEDFENEILLVNNKLNSLIKYKGIILDNCVNLYELLKLDEEISISINKLNIYTSLTLDIDMSDSISNKNYGMVMNLYNEYNDITSFVVPEILKFDYSKIEEYINENENLKGYKRLLKEMFKYKEHTLSTKEEGLIAKLYDAFRLPEEAMEKLTSVDMDFGYILDEDDNKTLLTSSNYSNFMLSNNRNVRCNAYKEFYNTYKKYNYTLSQLLSAHIKNSNNLARTRKYKDEFDKSLFSNDINKDVFINLIDSMNDNLDIIHKRYKMKKEILGLDKLYLYDMNAPIVSNIKPKYDFESCKEIIINSLGVMGEGYLDIIKRAFDERWIDVYPTKNKRSGAYCNHAYNVHPYVLLNHEDTFHDMSTITHELGHALQFHYASLNNSFSDHQYSIFVAEVASQVNEILLIKYLLDKTNDKDEKLYLYNELINNFSSAVERQTMFAEYEKKLYDLDASKVILTNDVLNDEYYNISKKYYGENVELDDSVKYGWSRIPHFYYNFYVYQYATGYIAALMIAEDLWNKKDGALDNYIKFLSLGKTLDPVESLKVTGVDFSSKNIYQEAFKVYDKTLEEFYKLYNS